MAYRQRRNQETTARTASQGEIGALQSEHSSVAVLDLSRQLAQLAQELETVKRRLGSLEATLGPPPPLHAAQKQGLSAATVEPGAVEASNRAPEPGKANAGGLPARSEPLPATMVAVLESAPAPPSHPTPWMMPSPEDPAHRVPRWTQWKPEFLQAVDSQAERVLDSMPGTIASQGHLDYAMQIRRWITDDKPLLSQIALLLLRRLVATKLSERQSKDQLFKLADWAVFDLRQELPGSEATTKKRLEEYLNSHEDKLKLLSVCLLTAVGTMEGPAEASATA